MSYYVFYINKPSGVCFLANCFDIIETKLLKLALIRYLSFLCCFKEQTSDDMSIKNQLWRSFAFFLVSSGAESTSMIGGAIVLVEF